jgi:hypothetical protein
MQKKTQSKKRLKPHHAPQLIGDKKVKARVDEMRKRGGCLYGII